MGKNNFLLIKSLSPMIIIPQIQFSIRVWDVQSKSVGPPTGDTCLTRRILEQFRCRNDFFDWVYNPWKWFSNEFENTPLEFL